MYKHGNGNSLRRNRTTAVLNPREPRSVSRNRRNGWTIIIQTIFITLWKNVPFHGFEYVEPNGRCDYRRLENISINRNIVLGYIDNGLKSYKGSQNREWRFKAFIELLVDSIGIE